MRYGERVILREATRDGREEAARKSFEAVEAGIWRSLGYSVVWWYTAVHSCLDGVYVDADHDYKGVCADLEIARAKVKVGGLLALNDYYRFEWQFLAERGRWGHYGIMHAANEYVRAGQPALLYLVPSIVGAGLCTALATGGRPAVDELLAYKEPAPEYTRSR